MNKQLIPFFLNMVLGLPMLYVLMKYISLKEKYFKENNISYSQQELFSPKLIDEKNRASKVINNYLKLLIVMMIGWAILLYFT